MDLAELLNTSPYSLSKNEKREVLDSFLTQLTRHHYKNCPAYSKMMDGIGYDPNKEYNYTELPFLPVRLFKMLDLLSVGKEEIVKTMTSSGTSGQAVSRIYLDRDTSANQTKVLTKIVSSFIGKQRVPMIIIDTDAILKNRNLFSARGAGILGFSMFGSKRIYALNEEMELNTELILDFLENHKNERIFLFGFTFMIWQHFYKQLFEKRIKLDLSNAVLIHGGGWKKLISESISSHAFKEKLNEVCGINHVHVPRHQCRKRLFGVPMGVLPQQFHVSRFLHLLINVRRREKVPIYFIPTVGGHRGRFKSRSGIRRNAGQGGGFSSGVEL